MTPKTKSTAPQKGPAKKAANYDGQSATGNPKPANINSILGDIGDLYQQMNTDDVVAESDGLDEVTIDEIIADESLNDETVIIDYGSEDDVPPPTDDDYLTFYEPAEVMDEVRSEDNPYFDEDSDAPVSARREQPSAESVISDALAAQNALETDDVTETEIPMLLDPEGNGADELYEAWREAEPLLELETETAQDADEDTEPPWPEELPISPEAESDWERNQALSRKKPQSRSGISSGKRCMFCSFGISANAPYCDNCGAPVNPKRVFHTYQEVGGADHNLIPCYYCGSMIYKRAHTCPKCNSTLLKPVYGTAEIKHAPKSARKAQPAKPQKQFGFLKLFILTLLIIAIAAMIVWKALLTTP